MPGEVSFTLNGTPVVIRDDGCSLLEALRDRLGVHSPKDGCAPQGQCGCCTVWVDGQPRVSCVTPARRVAGRSVTTVEGLDPAESSAWAEALCDTGGSQCGFCTPGIVMRLAAHPDQDDDAVRQDLLAHVCRCTGWQSIVEAAGRRRSLGATPPAVGAGGSGARDIPAAERRALIEGRTAQRVGADVALGRGGFADDAAPADALVAMRAADGMWHVAETLTAARQAAGKVQGRRTTLPVDWPIALPAGDWERTLQTTWVDPGYLELDASWCVPGGEPASTVGNGGAFGGKLTSDLGGIARELADRHGRPVRVLSSREDVIRLGPKRPPVAIGARSDGSGHARVAATPGLAEAIRAIAPHWRIEEIDVAGPPTSAALRGAGWIEAAVVAASLLAVDEITSPDGAWASAVVDGAGVHVRVRCGRPLDDAVLRSFCTGAAHMAIGWVRSEALVVDRAGEVQSLTVRSLGILRAADTPPIHVTIEPDDTEPVNGSDAVFAAVAAAAWRAAGHPARWPVQPAGG